MRTCILTVLMFVVTQEMFAQKLFTEKEFISVLRQYHPLAKEAELGIRYAEAEVTSKRAGFDPEFNFENSRKELESVSYYSQNNSQLKIPSWYGIDLVAGRESISGDRINPEETTGSLTYVGISIPLLKNLAMDKRRAGLLQAKQFVLLSAFERNRVLNDLIRDGLIAYWNWWETYRTYQLVSNSLSAAERRLQMTRTFVIAGERAAIDSIEALTQVQNFVQKQMEARMNFQKAGIELSVYLWKEGAQPYDLPADALPQTETATLNLALEEALLQAEQHPEIKSYEVELNALDIEKRLKFQALLPSVNLKYNQLGKDKNLQSTFHNNFLQNNFQYGLSVSVPLRFSEGRGEYRKARIRIDQTRLKQVNKKQEIRNKVKQYFTEWKFTTDQVFTQEKYVANILKLQQGEEQRFLNGESSLFLINARELKTLESKEKLIELEGKSMKSMVSYKWSIGDLSF
jgi:outer membrane protein TolC